MTGQAGGLSATLGRPWWVRLRAALATGLVLGVGATTTLASWTDQVDVEASFAASTFVVEANTTTPFVEAAGSWSAYTDTTAELQFTVRADDMTPGSTRYASIALRTAIGSLGGHAVLSAQGADGPAGGLGAALRQRVIISRACGAPAFAAAAGTDYLIGGPGAVLPLTTGQDPDDPFVLADATDTAPGEPTHLCVEVSLPAGAANELQGKQATGRWSVDAISETT